MDYIILFSKLAEPGTNPALDIPVNMDMILRIFIIMVVAGLATFFAIQMLICWLLARALKVVPPQLRIIPLGTVWLLMIPLFNFLWNFFIFPQISKSLKRYADSQANYAIGDCGESLGWAYSGLMAGAVIPYLGSMFAMAAFVIMIIYLAQISLVARQLRNKTSRPVTASLVSSRQTGHGAF
ncbi:MAG: hypothetical protein PVH19_04150 [Planctomycetia bacterium]|jgi:hypothetical protein